MNSLNKWQIKFILLQSNKADTADTEALICIIFSICNKIGYDKRDFIL